MDIPRDPRRAALAGLPVARDHTSVVRPKHLQYYQENRHKTLATNTFSAPRRRR
jgi:hypothetical protein